MKYVCHCHFNIHKVLCDIEGVESLVIRVHLWGWARWGVVVGRGIFILYYFVISSIQYLI